MLRKICSWMKYHFVPVSVVAAACLSLAAAEKTALEITKPTGDKPTVGDMAEVEGTCTLTDAKIWIIVKPVDSKVYWVQAEATVQKGGKWDGQANIGEVGKDFRKYFQIRAVANPVKPLKEGDQLSKWPKGEESSSIVKVMKTE
jgi:hypothetical protein